MKKFISLPIIFNLTFLFSMDNESVFLLTAPTAQSFLDRNQEINQNDYIELLHEMYQDMSHDYLNFYKKFNNIYAELDFQLEEEIKEMERKLQKNIYIEKIYFINYLFKKRFLYLCNKLKKNYKDPKKNILILNNLIQKNIKNFEERLEKLFSCVSNDCSSSAMVQSSSSKEKQIDNNFLSVDWQPKKISS